MLAPELAWCSCPVLLALTTTDVAPASAVGDVAELLHVDVEHRAGMVVLVTAHRFPRGAVHMRQSVQVGVGQDPVDRQRRDPQPTRSAVADLSRIWELRDAVGETPHAVLLTFARKGTTALAPAREALAAEGMTQFDTEIPLREDMHLAFGYCLGPDMHGYDQVADEMMEMTTR